MGKHYLKGINHAGPSVTRLLSTNRALDLYRGSFLALMAMPEDEVKALIKEMQTHVHLEYMVRHERLIKNRETGYKFSLRLETHQNLLLALRTIGQIDPISCDLVWYRAANIGWKTICYQMDMPRAKCCRIYARAVEQLAALLVQVTPEMEEPV